MPAMHVFISHALRQASRVILVSLSLWCFSPATAQSPALAPLTIEKIMADPQWIGSSPSNAFWDSSGKVIYFSWNPEQAWSDSTYAWHGNGQPPVKLSPRQKQEMIPASALKYNQARTAYAFVHENDIWYADLRTGQSVRLIQTLDTKSIVSFAFGDSCIIFSRSQNLVAWNVYTQTAVQLTNIQRGSPETASTKAPKGNEQEEWLKTDQLVLFDVLRQRHEKQEAAEAYRKATQVKTSPRLISIGDKILAGMNLSPDGRFVAYRLSRSGGGGKSTIVPAFVTETGFTQDLNARPKVGGANTLGNGSGITPTPAVTAQELWVYDRITDSAFLIKADSLPGITDIPEYLQDYPADYAERKKKMPQRAVTLGLPVWSPNGTYAVLSAYSLDNKDRWIVLMDAATGKLRTLDRQHDSAWIGGPGIGGSFGGNGNLGWIDDQRCWFQSEATGYSHLYSVALPSGKITALTSGRFEVQQVRLSNDRKTFYLTTNAVHPGEKHFYHLPSDGGTMTRITSLTGAHEVEVSPDEKRLAVLYSYSNKPTELYVMDNRAGADMVQVTDRARSPLFKSYPWREPEVVTFKASDGAEVYARLYKPANPHPAKPAVIFVHGAGYLQNAHKWWSSYFREYMFHNLLADQGYHILDIDYRASAGYGRDWRTGIYRFMGGKDLQDHVDGANWLVKQHGVDPKRIGIYGGSYGGFITLMALFTTPDVFAAGAALRPVTDWAHYNHGYTSNILNTPPEDSLAYRRSSPIYHAAGLKNALLICHGMVDVNVHFQDVVRLQQRLIELGKDNWEVAAYPVEDHGFVEPTSWTDEYKRILRLFERELKK